MRIQLPSVIPVKTGIQLPSVIPVKTGIQLPSVIPVKTGIQLPSVIPVKTGIQKDIAKIWIPVFFWISAFAGITEKGEYSPFTGGCLKDGVF